VLLYAHWEGFIKRSAESFLEYVERKNHHINEITFNLAALSLRKQLDMIKATNKYSKRTESLQEIQNSLSNNAILSYNVAISAKSNLNNNVFLEIAHILGLNISFYEVHASDINDLVDDRNKIAHGEDHWITMRSYKEREERILKIMTDIKTDIENNCALKSYLRS